MEHDFGSGLSVRVPAGKLAGTGKECGYVLEVQVVDVGEGELSVVRPLVVVGVSEVNPEHGAFVEVSEHGFACLGV